MGNEQKKRAKKRTKTENSDYGVGNAVPQKIETEIPGKTAEESVQDSDRASGQDLDQIGSSVMRTVNGTTNIINSLLGACAAVSGLLGWVTKNKEAACLVFPSLLAIVGVTVVSKVHKRDIFTMILAGIVAFAFGLTVSLAAIGYNLVGPQENMPAGNTDSEVKQEQMTETLSERQTEIVAPTESPLPTYEESRFEDQITSAVWKELLTSTEQIGVTGTEENFQTISDHAWQVVNAYIPESAVKRFKKSDRKKIRKNVAEIEEREKETKEWEDYVVICEKRVENYKEKPILENAKLKGLSSLDCLDRMGRVNGKEQKNFIEAIYNKDNLLLYGSRAIDGITEWRYALEVIGENYDHGLIGYYYGQIFHHLGDASEMMTGDGSVASLVLSAVFYSEDVVDDDSFYEDGKATTKQYDACKNLAIVCDKLDNKLHPEDSFFLLKAEKYYQCALWNDNMQEEERENTEKYLEIVKKKKRSRGL